MSAGFAREADASSYDFVENGDRESEELGIANEDLSHREDRRSPLELSTKVWKIAVALVAATAVALLVFSRSHAVFGNENKASEHLLGLSGLNGWNSSSLGATSQEVRIATDAVGVEFVPLGATSNIDCWALCQQRSGWCSWCGSGMACCRKGHPGEASECLGFGGDLDHRCVRIPAQASSRCGGENWHGATSCVPGYTCLSRNSYWSECRLAEAEAHDCAAPYATCGGWRNNAPWQTCCTEGHSCVSVSTGIGTSRSQCLPSQLLHPGEDCFGRCGFATGDCDWCGEGNACCAKGGLGGPPECYGAHFLTSQGHQCVAPKEKVVVKHGGQSCWEHCGHSAGSCRWCGEGNACCKKGALGQPRECHDVQHFSAWGKHVCVKPVHSVVQEREGQDCWTPCKQKGGYCQWCGEGKACCRKGADNDPVECLGITSFSRSDQHVCVRPPSMNVENYEELGSAVAPHPGEDCWYKCKGAGFCSSMCGKGNACCRKGAHNDPPECSGVTYFSSSKHHVCGIVPRFTNKVQITAQKPFRVLYNGKDIGPGGKVRGVAGSGIHADKAKEAGADAIRTWSVEQTAGAMERGNPVHLKVAAGIYLTTFPDKYEGEFCKLDNAWWKQELDKILMNVTRDRNNPALLWWQVGNELELHISWAEGSDCLYRRLEWVASHVKRFDPNHPVGTAIAGFSKPKVQRINMLCPSLDFIGLNVYGGDAYHIEQKLASAGWRRPYAVTEYGAAGAWMVPLTPWGSPVEPTSSQKAGEFRRIHKHCLSQDGCLGTFAFIWGWKWEYTPTWFSTINDWRAAGNDEPSSDIVDAMQEVWTGKLPKIRAPKITATKVWNDYEPVPVPLGFTAGHGAVVRIDISAHDLPHNDAKAWEDNEVTWVVAEDTPGLQFGATSVVNGAVQICSGSDSRSNLKILLDTSALQDGGTYRIYSFVRSNVGPQNWQWGCSVPVDGDPCDKAVRWIMESGTSQHPEWYPSLTPASTYGEVQYFLSETHKNCPAPCTGRANVKEASINIPFKVCADASPSDRCGHHIAFARDVEMKTYPERYPNLTSTSSFRDWQRHFHSQSPGKCPAPCDECREATSSSKCAGMISNEIGKIRGPLTAPFSGASMWSSFAELQGILKKYNKGGCPQPCALSLKANVKGKCPA
eukprot:TRINITY_DN5446_c0_g3_i1.p1 TRINITY_DN5446_c0_g3~~TRINITY_DN5446_c0_g3_i1.p1  ORF type:complete len:1148 (+),score=179.25 TRINITY_DN5446_c0_g3_i1:19-3462(+)